MNQKTILYAAGAFGVAALLYSMGRSSTAGLGALTGSIERQSGVQALYAANTGQQAGFSAAVQANWDALQRDVFKSQPDFWV